MPDQCSPALDVLVVEDDPDIQANLQDLLEMDGHRITLARSVRDVMAQDDLNRFGAILLDRRLPDGTGDDLLPYLRAAATEAAVFVITGYADLEGAVAAVRHGAADYLPKPIEPELLRSRLSRIGEQQQMRRQLADAERRLFQSERLAAIGQTLAVLSHEARNELSGLRLGLSLLPNILDERETALEVIGHLTENTNRLCCLFEDVRGFAAPIHLERALCDVGDVWRAAWSSLKPVWERRDVSFEEETGGVGLTLPADAFRLEQVFRNLFENSLAACPDPVVVSVSCRRPDDRTLSVAVRDNGPGLTGDGKEHVFDAFFTTKASGTGLGMAIVKRIVEAHGGTIGVGEEAIRGAEFIIALPVARSQLSRDAVQLETVAAPSVSSMSPSPASG